MNRNFSLATLMLLIAVAAIQAASMRASLSRLWSGNPGNLAPASGGGEIVGLVAMGAVFGLAFGLTLAFWNRSGWLRGLAYMAGGFLLGATAGAQFSVQADWPALLAAPFILLPCTLLVALTRRSQSRRKAAAPVVQPSHAGPIAPRAVPSQQVPSQEVPSHEGSPRSTSTAEPAPTRPHTSDGGPPAAGPDTSAGQSAPA